MLEMLWIEMCSAIEMCVVCDTKYSICWCAVSFPIRQMLKLFEFWETTPSKLSGNRQMIGGNWFCRG